MSNGLDFAIGSFDKCSLVVFGFFKGGFLRDIGSMKMRENHNIMYSPGTFRILNKIIKV